VKTILWWDWLLSSTADLKRRGLDPNQRVIRTGHRRALSATWARTIGMWCRADPADIMHRIAPYATSEEEKRATRSRYDVFRHRHQLLLRREFIKRCGMDPNAFMEIGPVVVAAEAHSHLRDHLLRSPGLSPGAACEQAALYEASEMNKAPSDRMAYRFGLLPIEMLLYYHAVEHIFEETEVTYEQWAMGGPAEKCWKERARYWKRFDCNSLVTLPAAALKRYPLDHEEND
jgi:hypothetical protein